MICVMPRMNSIMNQMIIAGPKVIPTFCVPNRWKKNSKDIITMTIGTVGMPGITISKPSIAEATEIGGVIIPSANNVVAPNIATIAKFFL